MFRAIPFLFLACLPLTAGPIADLAAAIRENKLDRDQCYRVRDLTLVKQDIRVYLTDGYLIFSRPVAGHPVAAVFTSQVENGDGEVLLRPPNAAERRSLARYIGSPTLDDHFQLGVFLFTGDDYQDLMAQMPNNPANRKAPEIGALLEEQYTPVLRNLSAGYESRLTLDVMNRAVRPPGLFIGIVQSAKLGAYSLFYDPENPDQVAAGQFVERDKRNYFDIWTHFPARNSRAGAAPPSAAVDLSDFRIDATVEPDWNLTAVTRVRVQSPNGSLRVVPFEIAREMSVSDVKVNGKPAEVYQRAAPTGSLGRGENDLFLVMPDTPVAPGTSYEFEFRHSGHVILEAANRVFYVTARGNWYPAFGPQFATYDLTFRYPRDLELVTAGDVVEDRTEGAWRITRRRPASPIRLAGFNLGDYAHARVTRGSYVVDVCANRAVDPELQPKPAMPLPPVPVPRGRGGVARATIPEIPTPPPVDPLARLQAIASGIGSALEFMASKFGPPALSHLTVSPIPGNFGQGYPGLIYLSTRSYLSPVSARLRRTDELFFDELLQVHETAHQWWGARVATGSYRDEWMLEALANYSALLYLEKTKGTHELEMLLAGYRDDLLIKSENGEIIDSAGPIVLGSRLENSLEPQAWRAITYEKGSWIIHMLRVRMGDERFFSMLAEMINRYAKKEITTENFRTLAAEFLPPKSDDPELESFFDQWVYGTGIPTLKLTYNIRGKAPAWRVTGTLAQSDVSEDFGALTPIEIQVAGGKPLVRWVRSGSEPASFSFSLRQQPLKVTLDPHYGVLRR